ncbi:VanW family protein [Christensenellaceae bacterium OttesenSCG-928-L17]|nr:VanW family protein [Christensenellaceae bacterium OttesenSCG-928-L17]
MAKRKKSAAIRALRTLMLLFALAFLGVGGYYLLYGPMRLIETIMPANEEEQLEDLLHDATFAEGISISGIPVANMTYATARNALLEVEASRAGEMQFVLHGRENSLTLTHADFDVRFDTEEILQEAIALGNTGTKREREAAREELLASPRAYDIAATVDTAPAAKQIARFALTFDTAPVDATVEMDMHVQGFFSYTEGIAGETLDQAALLAELQRRVDAGEYGEVELPLLLEEPAVSIETLQATLGLRAKAETSFKKAPYNRDDRVYNVKKAAGFVNGTVLKPDEVFSTNDTLGPRTYELGWKPAPAYVSGTTEDQAGGGVCQVSSTLYAAVVKADLEIVHRRNHSSPVGYIDRGLDATINTGTIDFQFKNNTGADIYIFAYTIDSADEKVPEGKSDKTIHIEIYGGPFPEEYDEIRLSAEKTETLSPSGEMEIIVDTTKAWDFVEETVERRNGSVYQSYKHYYKDGVEVKKESLAKSTYRAYAGKRIVGPGYYATTR